MMYQWVKSMWHPRPYWWLNSLDILPLFTNLVKLLGLFIWTSGYYTFALPQPVIECIVCRDVLISISCNYTISYYYTWLPGKLQGTLGLNYHCFPVDWQIPLLNIQYKWIIETIREVGMF